MRRELSKPVLRVHMALYGRIDPEGATWVRAVTPLNQTVWILNRPDAIYVTN